LRWRSLPKSGALRHAESGSFAERYFQQGQFLEHRHRRKGCNPDLQRLGLSACSANTAADRINKITPAEISDSQEVIARAKALSLALGSPICPGFRGAVFKALREIEDIYELSYIRKDGCRFPAIVSQWARPLLVRDC
jgi:hypothetical protein